MCNVRQLSPHYGSLRSTRGPAPAPPLNNKTPMVATNSRVCTALCMHHNSHGQRVNGKGTRVKGVAFGVQCPPTVPTLRLATLNAGASPCTPLK